MRLINRTKYFCPVCRKTKRTYRRKCYEMWFCSKECYNSFLNGEYLKEKG